MKKIAFLIPVLLYFPLVLGASVNVSVNVVPAPTLLGLTTQLIGITVLGGLAVLAVRNFENLTIEKLIALMITLVIGIILVGAMA